MRIFQFKFRNKSFCLDLRSGIIALLDMLICSLLARRSDFALRIANKLAYLQRKCILRKLTKKKYLVLVENQPGVYLVSLAAAFVSSRNAHPPKGRSVA